MNSRTEKQAFFSKFAPPVIKLHAFYPRRCPPGPSAAVHRADASDSACGILTLRFRDRNTVRGGSLELPARRAATVIATPPQPTVVAAR